MIQDIWTYLSGMATALDIYTIGVSLIAFGLVSFAFLRFFFWKELRLFQNRKRPIMIFKSRDQSMDIESRLLKDSELFTIREEPTEHYQNTARIKDHGLIIVGYTRGMPGFQQILNAAQQHHIPIIIYAAPGAISDDDSKALRQYTYHSICNLPLRLVNDVFTILSTFPQN